MSKTIATSRRSWK